MLCRSPESNDWSLRSTLHLFIALVLIAGLIAPQALAHDQEIEGAPEDVPAAQHAPCIAGTSNSYLCSNIELVHFVPLSTLGAGSTNDIWGWTDPLTDEEYAIVGLNNGTAFVHIDEFGHPTYLGRLPTRTTNSSWRDMKVYKNHVYIVSEAANHGMQVFDLTRLRNVDPANAPVTFFLSNFNYLNFRSAHNIAINEDTGFAYAVGAGSCRGGLHMIDIAVPASPVFAGCFGEDRYTHDAQCVIYHGPDVDYQGREICFNSNEDTVTIVDVTEKPAPVMVSRAPYFGSAYTHQGWLTEDHAYFLLDDELDERRGAGETRTFVWDVSDLDAPFVTGVHRGSTTSIDHNQYVLGNHVFQANYRSGIRVLRLGDLSEGELAEVAYFDTTPEDDLPIFSGTWSVYPYFKSGYVVASDIHRGLYILWPHLDAISECSDGIDNDGDGLRDFAEDPTCIGEDAASESVRFDVDLTIDPRYAKKEFVANSSGNLRLSIIGSDTVDVLDVDTTSLLLHPGDTVPRTPKSHAKGKPRDIDKDGIPDLPMKVRLDAVPFGPGIHEACVSGLLRGDAFEACAEVDFVEAGNDGQTLDPPKKNLSSVANSTRNITVKKYRNKAEKNANAVDHPL